MNNQELSYKLKYILKELGVSKQEFLKLCQRFSPSISKPTVLNAINGKNTILPTIETLSVFIKVCQSSGNEKIRNISYDIPQHGCFPTPRRRNQQSIQYLSIFTVNIRENMLRDALYFMRHANI